MTKKNCFTRILIVLSLLFFLCGVSLLMRNPTRSYAAQAEITAERVDFSFEAGASARMQKDSSGLRFRALMGTEEYSALKANPNYTDVSFGMFIVPCDMHEIKPVNYQNVFGKDRVYTTDANESGKVYVVNLTSNKLFDYEEGKYKCFSGAIINILPQNYVREFVAISYIKVETDAYGTEYFFKSTSDNRSVVYIAQAALADNLADPDNILGGFVNAAKSQGKTSTYVVEHYKDGVFAEKETLTAVVGTKVTPTAKNYDGYTAEESAPTEIYANNKTVIKLNYTNDDIITVLNSAQDLANGNMYASNANYATLTLSDQTVCGRKGNVFEWTGVQTTDTEANWALKFSSNVHSQLKAGAILYIDLYLTAKEPVYCCVNGSKDSAIYGNFNGTAESGASYQYYTEYGVKCSTGNGIWGSGAYLNQWITLEYKLASDWNAGSNSYITSVKSNYNDFNGKTVYISNVRIAKSKPIDMVNQTVIEVPEVTDSVADGTYNYNSGIAQNGMGYDIVSNRNAEYIMVIPANASANIVNAANELNSYIKGVSGVTLNIVRDNQTVTGNYISIGDTIYLGDTDIDLSALTNDGYSVKTIDGNIYIAGINERATKYAIYTFIERFLGVRWLNQSYTHIPTASTITVNQCDIVEQAVFENRMWYGGDSVMTANAAQYKDHSRFYTGEETWGKGVASTHNTTDYGDEDRKDIKGYVGKRDIDPTDSQGRSLGETHPEYFTDYTNKQSSHYDLCFTNGIDENGNLASGQSVASLMIDKIKSFLIADDGERKIQFFMIGIMDDSQAICQCATCQARRAQYGESGMSVIFMNCIEENVNAWLQEAQNRKVNIIMFAYSGRTSIPPTVKNGDGTQTLISPLCRANERVYVRLAPISADYTYSITDSRQDKTQFEALEGWRIVADNLMMWDYTTNFHEYFWYFPNMQNLKENLEYYRDIGVTYVLNQSSYTQSGIWFDSIKSYVSSKLYWNLEWSVEQLVDEYIELYYGEAADAVKKVIKILDNYYAELRDKGLLQADLFSSGNYLQPSYYNINLMTTLIELIESEEEKIKLSDTISSQEKTRIIEALWAVKLTPMTMILRNYSAYYSDGETDFATKYLQICDYLGITRLSEGMQQVADLAEEYGIVIDELPDLTIVVSGDTFKDDLYA